MMQKREETIAIPLSLRKIMVQDLVSEAEAHN
jgi:hypothetical protein